MRKNNNELTHYSFLNTVSDNKTYFSRQEIKGADTSRNIQEYLFFPSSSILKTYVNKTSSPTAKLMPMISTGQRLSMDHKNRI